MPLIPLHISAAVELLCLCSVYQIRYNVSIYINLILRPNLPMKSRNGGFLFFAYFQFIQILNSPGLNFTIRVQAQAKARVSHSKIFLPWFSLSNFLQAVRCCRHAYIIAHVRYIVKPKTGNICEKFLNRCVKLLRFHIVLNLYYCSFNAFSSRIRALQFPPPSDKLIDMTAVYMRT